MIADRTIGRYLNVYFCIGTFFATYSYILDLIFHSMEYKREDQYIGSMGGYFLVYIGYFFISLPVALVYNAIINSFITKPVFRIVFGVCLGAIGGYLFNLPSSYIGKHVKLKIIIVMILVGLSVEIIRTIVVRRRELKKNWNENSF